MRKPMVLCILILAFLATSLGKILEMSLSVDKKAGIGRQANPRSPTYGLGNKRHHRFYIQSTNSTLLWTEVGYDYTLDMFFGSNKKKFKVSIDTGSSDLWIPSVECTECYSKVRFDCKASTTCVEFPEEIHTLTYLDGPATGHVAFDDITIGNLVSLKNVSFTLIKKTVGDISFNTGLMGLGKQELSSNPNPTLINKMYQDGKIQHYAFSIFLTLDNSLSKIIFGGWDPKLARAGEKPVYADIISSYSYTVKTQGIRVGPRGPLLSMPSALIDSGNSMMTLAKPLMDQIINQIRQTSKIDCYYVPLSYSPQWLEIYCAAIKGISSDYPDVTISLDQKNVFHLSANDYLENCTVYNYNATTVCLTKFESSEFMGMSILGAAFMQAYYTIFDLSKNHIGFVHSVYEFKIRFKFVDNEAAGVLEEEAEAVVEPAKSLASLRGSASENHGSKNSAPHAAKISMGHVSHEVQVEKSNNNNNSDKDVGTNAGVNEIHHKVNFSGAQTLSVLVAGLAMPVTMLVLSRMGKYKKISDEQKYSIFGVVFLAATVITAISLSLSTHN